VADYTDVATVRATEGMGLPSQFDDATLTAAIGVAEDLIDQVTGTSFVYKAFTGYGYGDGTRRCRIAREDGTPVLFGRTFTSVTIGGTAVADTSGWSFDATSAVWRDEGNVFDVPEVPGPPNVVVVGTAGKTATAPAQIARAATLLARHIVLEDVSRVESRALSISNEYGQVRLSTPGRLYPTGVPMVDAVLDRYREIAPVVG